jgi:predicted molibdopterin-dependent oxidoreductase YjgC
MGAYPELLPGGVAAADMDRRGEFVWGANPGEALDVLYLVGEAPMDERPRADFVIYQNITPPRDADYADLVLPAAAFSEVDGTVVSGDGRIRRVRKTVDTPGDARPDWEILSRVARRMGAEGFEFTDVRDVHEEIARLVRGFGDFDSLEKEPLPCVCEGEMFAVDPATAAANAPQKTIGANLPKGPVDANVPQETVDAKTPDSVYPFVLAVSTEEHTYRGFPISAWVGGAREIFPDGWLEISPGDAERARIAEGDDVVVRSTGFERTWKARIVEDQIEGLLRVTLPAGERPSCNPLRVNMRTRDV